MESMGVTRGCSSKEAYKFPHITYPYSSCICSFWQQHPYFLFIYLFRSCSGSFLKLNFMYYINFSRSIITHTGDYRHPMAAI